jgi:hypothetical protein
MRNNTIMMNQLEALKINSNNEIQRLKAQIVELEIITEKVHRLQALEHKNKELERETKELKALINRVFKVFQDKLNSDSKSISGYDEHQVCSY